MGCPLTKAASSGAAVGVVDGIRGVGSGVAEACGEGDEGVQTSEVSETSEV